MMKQIDIDRFKVKSGEPVRLSDFPTNIPLDEISDSDIEKRLEENTEKLQELQQRLLAEETQGVIISLQALDAAGKDEAVRYLFSRLSSQALHTTSFSKPDKEDLLHDYLWRLHDAMPKRGMIGVFNRSHYEELIAAKVYDSHRDEPLPEAIKNDPEIWQKRYTDVRNFEHYLANNGFYMIKIYLHVSKEVQKERLLDRIDNPNKNWEFSMSDLTDREHWDEQMEAFRDAFQYTSTESAPWFIIPADHGDYGRMLISEILLKKLEDMNPKYPKPSDEDKEKMKQAAIELRDGKYD